MFNDLFWLYRTYEILAAHGPVWTEDDIDRLDMVIENIHMIESESEVYHV